MVKGRNSKVFMMITYRRDYYIDEDDEDVDDVDDDDVDCYIFFYF